MKYHIFFSWALMCLLGISCQSDSVFKHQKAYLITPQNEKIETFLAISPTENETGLSGIKPDEFNDKQSMFFYFKEDGIRAFWMPNTYFDLDLFYLDKNLTITHIIRKLPHFPSMGPREDIPRADSVWARYVLEMKASSQISQNLKVGDSLKWESPPDFSQKE